MTAPHRRTRRSDLTLRVANLAATQYGAIGRSQALELGATKAAIKAALSSGRWEQKHRGVYIVRGAPQTWHQELMAVCLLGTKDIFASHRSAAVLLRLAGFEREGPIEISTTRNLRRFSETVVVHKVLPPPACDVAEIRGIPATDPARTLIDLAGAVRAEVLEIALDDALNRRLVTIARLRWRIRTLGVKGRPGTALLKILIEDRRFTTQSESPLETRFLRLVRESGLPLPSKQLEIRDSGRFVARVDFAYPEQRIAIEVDGYAHHSGRLDFENDRERRNWLETLGWRVINVTDRQMRYGQSDLIERLRKMLL